MENWKKPIILLLILTVFWLSIQYILPVMLPFIIGLLLALGAEPFVSLAQRKFRFPRPLATGIGVSLTLLLLSGILTFLSALVVKELGRLAGNLPDMGQTVRQGLQTLETVLTDLSRQAPESVQPILTGSVSRFFRDGTLLTDQVTEKVPAAISAIIGWVPDGALGIGTTILSAFMLSGKLPRLRAWLSARIANSRVEGYLAGLKRCRLALGGWLKAQLKLSALTFGIVGTGFLLLRIPYSLGWAAVIAVVDAVPVLGTGTILVPWALILLFRRENLTAIGLLAIYAVALIVRTVAEPRLVGRHLGLDPLVTLLALYLGYRLWGIPGMLFAPVAATAAKTLIPKPGA